MKTAKNAIFIDYVNPVTRHKFHLPLTVFKKPYNQKEYDFLESILDKLIDEIRDNEDHSLAPIAQVIGDNLEDFDNQYHIPIGNDVTDIELIRYIMDDNHLSQKDLIDIFGNQGNVSKFLNAERRLSKTQIAKIVKRFNLSADFFFKSKTAA